MGAKKINIVKIVSNDEPRETKELGAQENGIGQIEPDDLNAAKPLAGTSPKELRLLITYSPKEDA